MSNVKLHSNLSSNSFGFENDADMPYELSSSGSSCSVYVDTDDFFGYVKLNNMIIKIYKYLHNIYTCSHLRFYIVSGIVFKIVTVSEIINKYAYKLYSHMDRGAVYVWYVKNDWCDI